MLSDNNHVNVQTLFSLSSFFTLFSSMLLYSATSTLPFLSHLLLRRGLVWSTINSSMQKLCTGDQLLLCSSQFNCPVILAVLGETTSEKGRHLSTSLSHCVNSCQCMRGERLSHKNHFLQYRTRLIWLVNNRISDMHHISDMHKLSLSYNKNTHSKGMPELCLILNTFLFYFKLAF